MFGVGAFAPSVLKCWYLAVAFPEGWRQQLGREVGPQHPGPRHCSGLLHTFKEIERRTLSHKHHRGTSVQSVGHPPTFPLLGAFMVGPWPLLAGGAHTLQLQDLSLGMRSQGRGVPEHRPPSPPTCLVFFLSENCDPDGLWVLTPTRSLETPTRHLLCVIYVLWVGRECVPEIKKS